MRSRSWITATAKNPSGGSWVEKDYTSYEEILFETGNHYPLNFRGDSGGAFVLHRSLDVPTLAWKEPYPATFGGDDGHVTAGSALNWSPTSIVRPLDSELFAQGATAIARTAPVNPAFSLSTALGELASDGLPMISGMQALKDRAKAARSGGRPHSGRSAGGEYLNVQFGWLPLVNDVRGFAKAVRDSHEILENYRKGSDKKIRRRYSFPSETATRQFTGTHYPDAAVSRSSFGTGTTFEMHSMRTWFSGAFRYHIPIASSNLEKFREWRSYADHLLGVNITPETLWNIAPWSWAIDWFTNTGDVMTNISNLGRDGMVLQYGYIMRHSRVETRRQVRFDLGQWGGPYYPYHTSRYLLDEWKVRLVATPYGFGVDLKGLTAKQVSILVALGLSRT